MKVKPQFLASGVGATWDTSATNWSGVSGTPWDLDKTGLLDPLAATSSICEYATPKRRCAAEKWVMRENDPPIGTLSAAARTLKNDSAIHDSTNFSSTHAALRLMM